MNNNLILAQAVVFAALLVLGGWILALVQIWKMPWVIPTTLYALVFYMAWGRFFEGDDSAEDRLENSDDRPSYGGTESKSSY